MAVDALMIGAGQIIEGDIDEPQREVLKAIIERAMLLESRALEALPDEHAQEVVRLARIVNGGATT